MTLAVGGTLNSNQPAFFQDLTKVLPWSSGRILGTFREYFENLGDINFRKQKYLKILYGQLSLLGGH